MTRWEQFVVKVRDWNTRSNGWLLWGVLLAAVVIIFRMGRRTF